MEKGKKARNTGKKTMEKKNTEKGRDEEQYRDYRFLRKIQPHGGITFKDESLIKTGNGYEACIHIYQYPGEVENHWMSKICNIPNTIALVDVSTGNVQEAKKNINRSMQEQNQRYINANNYGEKYDAQQRFREMQELYDAIGSMGEVVKLIDTRIFVADYSRENIENKIKKIMTDLDVDQYTPTIYLNETKREWESMFRTYKEQQDELFAVGGQEIQSTALAGGHPFHFSSLSDDGGTYFGQTPCGGIVNLNLFSKTKKRLYYNAIVSGEMGSGKSTLLKKLFLNHAAVCGDFVRTFDITGEFEELTRSLGGRFISPDGGDGVLNPLEILRASDNDSTNYMMHLSKLTAIYRFLEPDVTSEEVTQFNNLARGLYRKFGLTVETDSIPITDRPAKQYPIFSDFIEYIEEQIDDISNKKYNEVEMEMAKKNILLLDRIHGTLLNIVSNYGDLFNHHTSMDNIENEQVVTFNLSAVKEMSENIFDAVIFNYVSLCWGNGVANGMVMKKQVEDGRIKQDDVVHFLMIIDESHRWINTQKPQALSQIVTYLREGRKYFCGLVMASQSIRDFMPGGHAESADTAVNQIKTLFELMQYKFLFRHDSSSVGVLTDAFNDELTETQLSRIPLLEQGENILCISGDKNLEFKVYLSPEEDKIFRGGV